MTRYMTKGSKAKSLSKNVLFGNRIPKDFFVTSGKGESDITVHAGSYHLALKSAGIEMANIMTYSSIMPGIAHEVKRPKIEHGAVVESIMAVATSKKGKRATAGIIYSWLHDRKTGKRFGGLVCEHNGEYTLAQIEKLLRASLNELYTTGFKERYALRGTRMLTESFVPKKRFGTALVAICFTSYEWPVLKG
jgi:arginine decarboxylase